MVICRSTEKLVVFLFLIAASVVLIFTALAQRPTGAILGVIRDLSDAVIGTTVTVQCTKADLSRKAVTDAGGAYCIFSLPVGRHDLKVECSGFKPETQTGSNPEVGQEAVIDFAPQAGIAEQQLQVTAEAQQVNTTNSTLGSAVSEQTMVDLPLNGRIMWT